MDGRITYYCSVWDSRTLETVFTDISIPRALWGAPRRPQEREDTTAAEISDAVSQARQEDRNPWYVYDKKVITTEAKIPATRAMVIKLRERHGDISIIVAIERNKT